MKQRIKTRKNIIAGMLLCVGLLLPFVTMQIPQIGNMLCPMHIPVLLCGFICGGPYGLIIGFITPLLRGVLFGMPTLIPSGICMAFELATYGLVAGIISSKLKNTMINNYITLIIAMIAGRIIWGVVAMVVYNFLGMQFTLGQFITAGFINAIPGIIVQLLIIPTIVYRVCSMARIDFMVSGTC